MQFVSGTSAYTGISANQPPDIGCLPSNVLRVLSICIHCRVEGDVRFECSTQRTMSAEGLAFRLLMR